MHLESLKIKLTKISTDELKDVFLKLDTKLTKYQRDNSISVENGLGCELFNVTPMQATVCGY